MLISSLRVVRVISASFLVTLGYFSLPTQAQVVSDQTLDSQVNRVDNNNLVIEGGQAAEQNLFHSFSEFSVPANSTVHFDNGANIENIFSRVTGGSISNIEGLIKANGSASLFLLNPAGIMFGENSQLQIGGSFIATTAEAIVFPDGLEFSAVDTDSQPMLTVNIPIGLQYGKSPGAIISEGVLRPNPTEDNPEGEIESLSFQTPDHTFAIVGGQVSLEGTNIVAERGSVEIGSVASEEFVSLKKNNQIWDFNYDRVDEFSQIEFSESSIFSGDGGSIQIKGKDIILTITAISNPTSNDTDGGDINLIATNSIQLDSSAILTTSGDPMTSPTNNTNIDDEKISGKGGNIVLRGKSIVFSNVSRISAETFSQGNGGEITIEGKNFVKLSGQIEFQGSFISSSISTNTQGEGAGGKITLKTNSLILEDEGIIESRADGDGDGGDIDIATDTLVLFDLSKITANAQRGNGGNVQINTQGLFVASEIDEQITADSENSEVGIDGTVEINTPDVDSQIDTKVVERSPLVVENLIYTGCGSSKDYISNKFSYIGRGGLPLNPMQEIATEDLMVDLGKLELPKTQNKMDQSIPSLQDKSHQEIREVTGWVVNQKGNIELISPTTKVANSSICLRQPVGTIDID